MMTSTGFLGGGTSAAYLLRRIARKSETDPVAREVLAAYEAVVVVEKRRPMVGVL